MTVEMLKAKIHRLTVVQAALNYVGSITLDPLLMEAAGIFEYQKVQVVNINTGSRLETYTIAGEAGSGMVCMNGAAARLASTGDTIIVMAYCDMSPEEAKEYHPTVVFVDEKNRITRVADYEKHGELFDVARDYPEYPED